GPGPRAPLHRRPDRRALRAHPDRAGDRDPADDRAADPRLRPRRDAHALAGSRRLDALAPCARGGARSRPRGDRRRTRDLRRRAAADARLPERHPRAHPAATADAGGRAARPRGALRRAPGRERHVRRAEPDGPHVHVRDRPRRAPVALLRRRRRRRHRAGRSGAAARAAM
ncbi:MAG: FxsA protein, partial [uncultured Solirubrobacteraceae bacterium]